MIGVINYGSGNINAIVSIYQRLNVPVKVIDSICGMNQVKGIVLPGVGAFDDAINRLNNSGLRSKLDECVLNNGVPVLGICVGMQIMAGKSEEGDQPGLGWFKDSRVLKIDGSLINSKTKLPHMGWNSITPIKKNAIFDDVDFEKGFYFLHSYRFSTHEQHTLCVTNYGGTFQSAVNIDNIFGFQFHPEKSHKNGIAIFKNFARLMYA